MEDWHLESPLVWVRKVLARKGEDGGSGPRLESDEVGNGGFIPISHSPDIMHHASCITRQRWE
jgi:hypothetical protein